MPVRLEDKPTLRIVPSSSTTPCAQWQTMGRCSLTLNLERVSSVSASISCMTGACVFEKMSKVSLPRVRSDLGHGEQRHLIVVDSVGIDADHGVVGAHVVLVMEEVLHAKRAVHVSAMFIAEHLPGDKPAEAGLGYVLVVSGV